MGKEEGNEQSAKPDNPMNFFVSFPIIFPLVKLSWLKQAWIVSS